MKQIVYIASPESKMIEAWYLNKKGELKLINLIETDGEIQPMFISKKHNLLYAGIRPNNRILTYSIEGNGCLKKQHESFIFGSPNYLFSDSQNKFLFCSFYHSNCITIHRLNSKGIPKELIQVIHNVNGCHAIKINEKYKIVLSTALKEDAIYLYYINKYGFLESTEQKLVFTKKGSGPRHISIHPNQDYIYTINELKNTIDVWKIYIDNKEVKIKNIQNVVFSIKKQTNPYWGADIHVTSCGRFLYVSDRSSNSIGLFKINLNNNFIVFIASYLTEEQPRSFCIDQSEKYLLVVGQKSNTLTIYYIFYDKGELIKYKTYNTHKGPLWILTHESNV